MKVQEYINQGDVYFSESQGNLVSISEMVPQYALNAWRKLNTEFGEEFAGSALSSALLQKVLPEAGACRAQMRKFGKSAIYVGEGGMKVESGRSRLRSAGAATTRHEGDWMYGYPPEIEVKVHAR